MKSLSSYKKNSMKRNYLYLFIALVSFLAGVGITASSYVSSLDFREKQYLNDDSRLAFCKGMSESRKQDINLFCTLIQTQLTPQECVKTDYIKKLFENQGQDFIGRCSGKTLNEMKDIVPTSSFQFDPFTSVDPIKHR